MRRVGRIIYNGAVVVSLLLFLATAGVWLRSYWVSDVLCWSDSPMDASRQDAQVIWISRGGIRCGVQHVSSQYYKLGGRRDFRHSTERAVQYPVFDSGDHLHGGPTFRHYSAI